MMKATSFQSTVAVLLVAGIPWAKTRGAMALNDGVWETTEGGLRISVCLVAMALGLTSTGVALWKVMTRDFNPGMLSLACIAYLLGIICYPYWVNGVPVASQRMLVNELDPKSVVPWLWFREYVVCVEAAALIGTTLCLGSALVLLIKVRRRLKIEAISWDALREAALPLLSALVIVDILGSVAWMMD